MKDQMIDYMNWIKAVDGLIPNEYGERYFEYIYNDDRNDDLRSMFKVGLSPLEATKAIIKMIDELCK